MKLRIISIGKVKQSFVLEGEAEYTKRLKSWCPIEFTEISNEKGASLPEETAKKLEAESLLKQIERDDFLIVLDERGKQKNSIELSNLLSSKMNEGIKNVTFAIGGAYGWDDAVRKRAHLLLSLSSLTFTYQMTRLILVEQLYRAFTLIKGVPYHKK